MRTLSLSLVFALLPLAAHAATQSAPFPVRAHWAESGDVGVMVLGPTQMSVLHMDGTISAAVTAADPIRQVQLTTGGTLIAYATESKVNVIRPDGTTVASLDAKSCMELRWSRDGSKLLYTSIEDGATAGQKRLLVYVVDSDGQNRRQILSQSYTSP